MRPTTERATQPAAPWQTSPALYGTRSGISGTYTIKDGSGVRNLTIALPSGSTAQVIEDFVITRAEVINGVALATDVDDAQREPSAVIDDQSLVRHTLTRLVQTPTRSLRSLRRGSQAVQQVNASSAFLVLIVLLIVSAFSRRPRGRNHRAAWIAAGLASLLMAVSSASFLPKDASQVHRSVLAGEAH